MNVNKVYYRVIKSFKKCFSFKDLNVRQKAASIRERLVPAVSAFVAPVSYEGIVLSSRISFGWYILLNNRFMKSRLWPFDFPVCVPPKILIWFDFSYVGLRRHGQRELHLLRQPSVSRRRPVYSHHLQDVERYLLR